jgi:branched-subunit amino acid aminotransferase/4-amino-4-deoxychorismate lyase
MDGTLAPARLWVSAWQRVLPTQLPSQFKLAQGITSTLALLEAATHTADEALLLNPHGQIAEAASANIFWSKKGTLYTPSLATGCVRGSMRAVVMRLSPLPVVEEEASLAALAEADYVWLTNGRIGIRSVAEILPAGYRYAAYELTEELRQMLARDKEEYSKTHAGVWR